jgi:cysteine desulfurase/selenocysteine lyase
VIAMKNEKIREQFEPAVSNWTYLNAAACGLSPQFAKKAADTWWNDKLSHGSVNYHVWEDQADITRKKAGHLINAQKEEIAFVMNTSQALNLAIHGIDFTKGDNVVVNKHDFPSNYLPWLSLKKKGVDVRCISVENHRITVENIKKLIDENTKAVSLSSVQFKSGFRCDLESIGALCAEYGALFLVDAIQSLGALEMDVKQYHIDVLATSFYKWLLGPDGIGFLYCNKDIIDQVTTTNIGWMSTLNPWEFPTALHLSPTAQKFESGTLPWVLIYSIDSLLDFFNKIKVRTVTDHIFEILDYLIEELDRLNVNIISSLEKNERSGILLFQVDAPEKFAELCQKNKVRISVRDGIRVSPHIYNTTTDIDVLIHHLESFLG